MATVSTQKPNPETNIKAGVQYLILPNGNPVKRTTYANGNSADDALMKGDVWFDVTNIEKLEDGATVGEYRPQPPAKARR